MTTPVRAFESERPGNGTVAVTLGEEDTTGGPRRLASLTPSSKILKEKNAQLARAQVKEMMVYCAFVLLFTFQTLFGQNSQLLFHFTDNLRQHIVGSEMLEEDSPNMEKQWKDVGAIEELYQYLNGPFREVVYGPATYDGDWTYSTVKLANSTTYINRRGWIVGGVRLLGGVRFGQIRVQASTCDLPDEFKQEPSGPDMWECVVHDDLSALESGPVGRPKLLDVQTGTLDEPTFLSPNTGIEFGAPNVWVMLPNIDPDAEDKATSVVGQLLSHLEENHYIDQYSRAAIVDLNLYNPNVDYIVTVRLVLEQTAGAGVIPTARFHTVRLFKDHTWEDHLRTSVEIVVMLFVVAYTVVEVKQMFHKGLFAHILSYNLPHMLNLVLFYVSTYYRIRAFFALPDEIVASTDEYIDLRTPVQFARTAKNINAFNAFLTWVKVFKYLHFIPRFRILLGTVQYAASRIGVFFVICAIVLFGAAQGFALAFGTNVRGYRNLTQSFFTLTRSLLGDFDFEELRQENPFLGPIMFFLFTLLAVFVLVNVFIAILLEAYEEVKETLTNAEDVTADQLTKEVGIVIFDDGLYRIPCLGQCIKSCAARTKNTVRATIDSLPSHAKLNALLRLSDRNLDGEVSPYEVAAQLDANADGEVSSQELYVALMAVGATPAAARRAVDAVDTNTNGVISTKELKRLVGQIRVRDRKEMDKIGVIVEETELEDMSSSSDDNDQPGSAVQALQRSREQRRRERAERKAAAAARNNVFNGIDNRTALRAINSVRLDMMKKQMLIEQIAEEGKQKSDREMLSELHSQIAIAAQENRRMQLQLTQLTRLIASIPGVDQSLLSASNLTGPSRSPVDHGRQFFPQESKYAPARNSGPPGSIPQAPSRAAAPQPKHAGGRRQVVRRRSVDESPPPNRSGDNQDAVPSGSMDSIHSVSRSKAYQRMVEHHNKHESSVLDLDLDEEEAALVTELSLAVDDDDGGGDDGTARGGRASHDTFDDLQLR